MHLAARIWPNDPLIDIKHASKLRHGIKSKLLDYTYRQRISPLMKTPFVQHVPIVIGEAWNKSLNFSTDFFLHILAENVKLICKDI